MILHLQNHCEYIVNISPCSRTVSMHFYPFKINTFYCLSHYTAVKDWDEYFGERDE